MFPQVTILPATGDRIDDSCIFVMLARSSDQQSDRSVCNSSQMFSIFIMQSECAYHMGCNKLISPRLWYVLLNSKPAVIPDAFQTLYKHGQYKAGVESQIAFKILLLLCCIKIHVLFWTFEMVSVHPFSIILSLPVSLPRFWACFDVRRAHKQSLEAKDTNLVEMFSWSRFFLSHLHVIWPVFVFLLILRFVHLTKYKATFPFPPKKIMITFCFRVI